MISYWKGACIMEKQKTKLDGSILHVHRADDRRQRRKEPCRAAWKYNIFKQSRKESRLIEKIANG
uniref:Uncharacterized protein n=1 Tax=Moniliophthora roreri TaxID=221103 RepID=A0A0W0F8A9_MONRR